MTQLTNLRGVVRGRKIELEQPLEVPDGESVVVTISYEQHDAQSYARKCLEEAAGAWADDAEELDQFLEWNQEQGQHSRPEIEP